MGEALPFLNLVQTVPITRLVFTLGTWMEQENWHRKTAALGSVWRDLNCSEVKLGDRNSVKVIQGK